MNPLTLLFGLPATNSQTGEVNKIDWLKTLRLFIVTAIGYALTVVIESVLRDLSSGAIDLGQFAMLQGVLVTVLSSALEIVRRRFTAAPKQD